MGIKLMYISISIYFVIFFAVANIYDTCDAKLEKKFDKSLQVYVYFFMLFAETFPIFPSASLAAGISKQETLIERIEAMRHEAKETHYSIQDK